MMITKDELKELVLQLLRENLRIKTTKEGTNTLRFSIYLEEDEDNPIDVIYFTIRTRLYADQ